jgi:hypothetical protein
MITRKPQRILIAAALALASSYATAGDTIRIDNRIITTGMSTAEVIDRAGQPSRTIQLENVYGAGVGERWEYYRKGKQYDIWLAGGKVVKVDES